MALDRYAEALDVCDRCLAFDPTNGSVRGQREKVLAMKEAWDNKEMEKAERQRKERQEQRIMNQAFQVSLGQQKLPVHQHSTIHHR